ncbi:hypothetical protein [Streptomyces venezuelae]|uniref:hypothetical protein n=1 Tax=Streptomyces venezuelae TaxID=54571 RepID=UPI0009030517|nr:hypothetical protein [Streptomyces venezuelae]APE26749.1 hypothetical protein vnz_37165 [Streptomyces venezuelae]
MTQELDPARQELLDRLRALPRYRDQSEAFLVRRISRMTDRQVSTVLAMADEELNAAPPAPTPQYAPATDDTPVILYHHVDGG